MEERKDGSAKTWGDMISSPWSRKSTSDVKGGASEPQSRSEESLSRDEEHCEDSARENKCGADDKLDEKEVSSGEAQAKSWGEMIYPSTWRRKSTDASELTKEVLQEEPIPEDEPRDNKLKGKCEGTENSAQVSAKTWGEMIHPALAWRRKSRDGAESSEPPPQEVATKDAVGDDELKETSDDVPRAAEGTLGAVAVSIKRSIAGMSRWSMGDLTLGLYKLSGRHALEGAADTINGSRVSSLQELQEIDHWFQWAFAAYKKNKEKLAKDLQIEETQIVKHVFTSGVLKPAYFIAVDNTRRCVVISIRGTLSATDVLTDLNPHSEKFEGGYAHSGMLAAARWLMENETTSLRDLLTENPEFRFVLVGHSLGAGTAALLCMLLRDYDGGRVGPLSKLGIPPSWITCWGYGCPPCVDKRLAEEAGFIRNIVLQDDVVARISPGALEDLRTEILETDWSQAFKDGSKGRRMLELAQSTLPSVAKKYGHAALVVARSGAFAGTRIHKAANWLSVGLAAADLLRSASSYRGVSTVENGDSEDDVDKKETEVAAATLAANVAQTVTDPKEALETERLYVPGLLYHILRKPLQPDMVLESALPAQANSVGGEKDKDESKDTTSQRFSKSSSKSKSKKPLFQHIIVRGDDPTSRFKRIVLSSTLLSDHGCHQYKESLEDALTWIKQT